MSQRLDSLPKPVLAVAPLFVLAVAAAALYVFSPFGDVQAMSEASTTEVLLLMTGFGLLAGVIPVAIGMLWFPFVRGLENRWVHAMLALSAGILAFIAFEMTEDAIDLGVDLSNEGAGTVELGAAVGAGLIGLVGTFYVMKRLSDWRRGKLSPAGVGEGISPGDGLRVAYLMAIGLGLHSIGEGLAIGTAYAIGEFTTVTLLVVGFVLHNVTEGISIVAAASKDTKRPSLLQFAALGLIAGGPLAFGGYLGAFADAPLLAIFFLAIGVGAILEVIWEVVELVRVDAESVATRINIAVFLLGVALMFVLEEIIVEGYFM